MLFAKLELTFLFALVGALLVNEELLFVEVGVSNGKVVEGPQKGAV